MCIYYWLSRLYLCITINLYIFLYIVDSEKQESTKSAAELKITTRDLPELYIDDRYSIA